MRSCLYILAVILLAQMMSCIDTKGYHKVHCDDHFVALGFTCVDTAKIPNPVWLDSLQLRSTRGFDLSAYSFVLPKSPTTQSEALYHYYNDQYKDSLYTLIELGDANHDRIEEFSFDTVYCKGWVGETLLIDTFMVVSANICHVYRHSGPLSFVYTPKP